MIEYISDEDPTSNVNQSDGNPRAGKKNNTLSQHSDKLMSLSNHLAVDEDGGPQKKSCQLLTDSDSESSFQSGEEDAE